jgi:hypothetical protein
MRSSSKKSDDNNNIIDEGAPFTLKTDPKPEDIAFFKILCRD